MRRRVLKYTLPSTTDPQEPHEGRIGCLHQEFRWSCQLPQIDGRIRDRGSRDQQAVRSAFPDDSKSTICDAQQQLSMFLHEKLWLIHIWLRTIMADMYQHFLQSLHSHTEWLWNLLARRPLWLECQVPGLIKTIRDTVRHIVFYYFFRREYSWFCQDYTVKFSWTLLSRPTLLEQMEVCIVRGAHEPSLSRGTL